MNASPARRIAYSIFGLAAGDLLLMLCQMLRDPVPWRELHLYPPDNQTPQIIFIYAFGPVLSVLAWALVGLPLVLLLPTRQIIHTSWPFLAAAGAVLGPLSLVVPLILLSRGEIGAEVFGAGMPILIASALVSGVAFTAHCALMRRYARSQAISSTEHGRVRAS